MARKKTEGKAGGGAGPEAARAAAAKSVRAARLDEAGVYQGMDEVPEAGLTALHLPQVPECDLPPGRYRWDGTSFVPLPRRPPAEAVKEPDALRAVALGLLACQRAGVELPQATRDWLAWHAPTIDRKG